MSGRQCIIEYSVKDAREYLSSNHTQISKINQKSGKPFKFMGASEQFNILLKLEKPSLLTKIQMKVQKVDTVQVWGEYQKARRPLKNYKLPPENMDGKAFIIELQADIILDHLQVCLENLLPSQSSIHHIIVKGITDQSKSIRIKNVSQDQQFKPSSSSKKRNGKQQGSKKKNNGKDNKKEKDVIYIDLQNNSEQENLKRALELSKMDKQLNGDEFHEFEQMDYDVVPFSSKMEKVIEHVNSSWIEAQKKAEKSLNVKNSHSLANRVKRAKCLKGMKICLNNIYYSERTQLMKLVKNLGGQIIEEPANFCLVVTTTMDGSRVNSAKKMKNVKFVKPSYLVDCHRYRVKLDYKDYRV